MQKVPLRLASVASLALMLSQPSLAGPREDLLAQYATTAKVSSFSAARGQALHTHTFSGGKAETPACTSCHGKDARSAGQTLTGKPINPMAVSITPTRYTDAVKIEKWFNRNCLEVLGRVCTAQEKGDWLSYMLSQ